LHYQLRTRCCASEMVFNNCTQFARAVCICALLVMAGTAHTARLYVLCIAHKLSCVLLCFYLVLLLSHSICIMLVRCHGGAHCFHTLSCVSSQRLYNAAATSVVDIEHIDDDEETMSISTFAATATTGTCDKCTATSCRIITSL
jgi:hypothetical protein